MKLLYQVPTALNHDHQEKDFIFLRIYYIFKVYRSLTLLHFIQNTVPTLYNVPTYTFIMYLLFMSSREVFDFINKYLCPHYSVIESYIMYFLILSCLYYNEYWRKIIILHGSLKVKQKLSLRKILFKLLFPPCSLSDSG